MRTRRRRWPVPELLRGARGAGWTVFESAVAMVELAKRRMWVPLGDAAPEANQRAHEMAHAAWTPPRLLSRSARLGIPDDVLRAVEDARMHARLGRAGIDLAAGLLKPDELTRIIESLSGHPFPTRLATLLLVAGHGTGQTVTALMSACEEMRRAALLGQDLGRVLAVTEALTLAREAGAMLTRVRCPMPRDTCRIARWLHERLTDKTVIADESWGYLLHGDGGSAGFVPWGTLTVETPCRPRRVPGAQPWRAFRPSDSGTIPRAWHRLAVDRAVFARGGTPGTGAGTVLIDASGSMRLTPQRVLEVIRRYPRATVAAYGGRELTGILRVLARDGWRVDDYLLGPIGGGMNVVDGEALAWLARQPPPRVWISDGRVTGIGDRTGLDNLAECEAICREAAILHVRSVPAAIAGASSRS